MTCVFFSLSFFCHFLVCFRISVFFFPKISCIYYCILWVHFILLIIFSLFSIIFRVLCSSCFFQYFFLFFVIMFIFIYIFKLAFVRVQNATDMTFLEFIASHCCIMHSVFAAGPLILCPFISVPFSLPCIVSFVSC